MSVLLESIVLKRFPVGESDNHYNLLTSEMGKIRVLVRGGRKIKSKLSPHLDGFSLVDILLIEGRNGYSLAGAKIKQDFRRLAKVDFLLSSASIFLSIIDHVLPENAKDEDIFQLTLKTLEELSQATNDSEAIIRLNSSIYQLLKILGIQPDISAVANQRELFNSFILALESATDRQIISDIVS